MLFYAVRHGAAKSKQEDPDRSLSDIGRSDTERIAALIKPLGISVEVVYHSGKARARQTAEILASSVESKLGVVRREGLEPDDDVRDFAKDLAKSTGDVMAAGHNPFMTYLVNYLITGDSLDEIVEFPTSGIACLERIGGKWRLVWFASPRMLGPTQG